MLQGRYVAVPSVLRGCWSSKPISGLVCYGEDYVDFYKAYWFQVCNLFLTWVVLLSKVWSSWIAIGLVYCGYFVWLLCLGCFVAVLLVGMFTGKLGLFRCPCLMTGSGVLWVVILFLDLNVGNGGMDPALLYNKRCCYIGGVALIAFLFT